MKSIEWMVKENTIRPSRSPYNEPALVVSKKGYNEDGSPKHRKLQQIQRKHYTG